MTKTTKCPGISTVVFVIDKGGGEYPKTTTTPSPSYFYVAKIRQTTTEMWRKGRVQIQGRIRKHNQQEKSERRSGGGRRIFKKYFDKDYVRYQYTRK